MDKINRILQFEKGMKALEFEKSTKGGQNINMMNELIKESENFKVVVCAQSNKSTGSKPCSRKFMGCQYVSGRLYIFGGSSV